MKVFYIFFWLQVVMLMTGPVPTTYNEPPKHGKGDNSSEAGFDTPKVNPHRKPVPEEGKNYINDHLIAFKCEFFSNS